MQAEARRRGAGHCTFGDARQQGDLVFRIGTAAQNLKTNVVELCAIMELMSLLAKGRCMSSNGAAIPPSARSARFHPLRTTSRRELGSSPSCDCSTCSVTTRARAADGVARQLWRMMGGRFGDGVWVLYRLSAVWDDPGRILITSLPTPCAVQPFPLVPAFVRAEQPLAPNGSQRQRVNIAGSCARWHEHRCACAHWHVCAGNASSASEGAP